MRPLRKSWSAYPSFPPPLHSTPLLLALQLPVTARCSPATDCSSRRRSRQRNVGEKLGRATPKRRGKRSVFPANGLRSPLLKLSVVGVRGIYSPHSLARLFRPVPPTTLNYKLPLWPVSLSSALPLSCRFILARLYPQQWQSRTKPFDLVTEKWRTISFTLSSRSPSLMTLPIPCLQTARCPTGRSAFSSSIFDPVFFPSATLMKLVGASILLRAV